MTTKGGRKIIYRYEILNKETKEELASFSTPNPFKKEQKKQEAQEMADRIFTNYGVECEVREVVK
jgi:hypothetical protein